MMLFIVFIAVLTQVSVLNSPESHWRSEVMCGPNSLYMVLQLRGCDVAYEDLREEMALTPDGVSIQQMEASANRHGLNLKPYRTNYEGLREIDFPAIVHVDPDASAGHYLVLLGANDEQLTLFDALRGEYRWYDKGSFLEEWSGIVLARPRSKDWPLVALSLATLCIVVLVLLRPNIRRSTGPRSLSSCDNLPAVESVSATQVTSSSVLEI